MAAQLAAQVCAIIGMLQPQLVLAEDARPYQKVSFYFAAHEDDWQLFMNPSAFLDVIDGNTKTVFVHLTAGDAGLGVGTGGRKHPYYLARENGAETAIRFMADSADAPHDKIASRTHFDGHQIYHVSYRNTAAYFLRLPDGNLTGAGFPETGNQSLQRLASGQIKTLWAVDGSAVYHEWTDLVSTLKAILDHERGRSPTIQLNVAELDSSINPDDHPDHRMTAQAALGAAAGLACARRAYYVDYASAQLPENLNEQERDMESSVLAVTAAGIEAFDHGSIWQRHHQAYLGRNYFRVEEATGRCENPVPEHTVASRQLNDPASHR
ncbi:MAG: hypothetical protein ACLPKB_03360 [Xanthobacteraceae bacterium]